MKRREFIKGITALGALALLPKLGITENSQRSQLHFVGLGCAGRNVLMHIYKKGISAKYTYLCYAEHPEKNSALNHIYYEYPRDMRQPNELGKQSIPLTDEMKKVLSDDRLYIVLVGLGAYSGTSLITNTLNFLESNNKPYLAICTLPCQNEGRSRNQYAQEKKTELEKYENVRFFDNKRIYELYQEERIAKTLELANEEIYRIFKQELHHLRT